VGRRGRRLQSHLSSPPTFLVPTDVGGVLLAQDRHAFSRANQRLDVRGPALEQFEFEFGRVAV
jgi:hypothetical protein